MLVPLWLHLILSRFTSSWDASYRWNPSRTCGSSLIKYDAVSKLLTTVCTSETLMRLRTLRMDRSRRYFDLFDRHRQEACNTS